MEFYKNNLTLKKTDKFELSENTVTILNLNITLPIYELEYLENGINLVFDKPNHSNSFLIPLVFKSDQNIFDKYLINVYTGFEKVDIKHIYLKYLKIHASEIETKFLSYSNFCANIDDDIYVYYKFQVPEFNLDDYHKLLEGMYSKVSSVGQKKILPYIQREFGESVYAQTKDIFSKADRRKRFLEKIIYGEINTLPNNAELGEKLKYEIIIKK